MIDPTEDMRLVFQDEFTRLRPDVWATRGTEYTAKSSYTKADPSCARVYNNVLVLSVKRDPATPGKYLTGHIGTQHLREFQPYGYYEANVKFPTDPAVLCGWWLQTTEDYIPGQSEIDIVECYGQRTVHHSVWWREEGMLIEEFADPGHISHDLGSKDAQATYHRYGVLWEPKGYTFYIDREITGYLGVGQSDRPKFLALSIKIPDYLVDRGRFDPTLIKNYKMRTKWVRVWQYV